MKQRKRYERSDVMAPSAHKTRNALIALAAIVIMLAGGVLALWNLAQAHSQLGDTGLSASVEKNGGKNTATINTQVSDHVITTVLVFIHADKDESVLSSAKLLSLDQSAGKGFIVNLPIDMAVSLDEAQSTLANVFKKQQSQGSIGVVSAATGVQISHVMVVNSYGWEKVLGLSNVGATQLAHQATELLSILHTDMSAPELLNLAETTHGIGRKNLSVVEAPCTSIAGTDGATQTVVDPEQLGLTLGTLVEKQ
ncbi:HlyD/EmrA/EmrK family protein [Atopobium fossor]|uniref:hypothetical protein n=1 Tax=Atopobium fossor TaxID=39487 RepID=UPI0004230289|nr:hypothetical protein [Atopobium fossor]